MNNQLQPSDTFAVAALLALSGGLLDAYSYLCRGGVFANAQTGNLVLLGVHAAQGEWRTAGSYLIPILAFVLGVLATEIIKNFCRSSGQTKGRLHWRQTVLLLEILTLAAVSFVPVGPWNGAVNVLVSFVCAMQVEAFRTVRGNPFASTMCTGNLRSGTEALYAAAATHDLALLAKGGWYFAVIACFVAGAALGVFASNLAPQRAVLLAAALQFFAFAHMRQPKSS